GPNTLLVQSELGIKVWDLPSAKICGEIKGFEIPADWRKEGNVIQPELTTNLRFLIAYSEDRGVAVRTPANHSILVVDLTNGKKREISTVDFGMAHLAPDGKTVAIGGWADISEMSFWDRIMDWFELQKTPNGHCFVKLIDISSEQDVIDLIGYWTPIFSPNGKTLATRDGTSLQLWDFPIRKPMGKILGLAALAAVATLLAFNGLGWLRRRRMRLKANLVPNSVPSTSASFKTGRASLKEIHTVF